MCLSLAYIVRAFNLTILTNCWHMPSFKRIPLKRAFKVYGTGNKKPDLRSSLHASGLRKYNDIANSKAFLWPFKFTLSFFSIRMRNKAVQHIFQNLFFSDSLLCCLCLINFSLGSFVLPSFLSCPNFAFWLALSIWFYFLATKTPFSFLLTEFLCQGKFFSTHDHFQGLCSWHLVHCLSQQRG